MSKKSLLVLLIIIYTLGLSPHRCFGKRVAIPARGKVSSFGTYSYIGRLNFDITEAGEQEIGTIIIEGTYNGEYPWIMRIYTDNTGYNGIAGAAKPQNPAGLISTDGRFTIPLLVNSPTFEISQYKIVPDINQSGYKVYKPGKLRQKTITEYTDCVIMAIDPRNEIWVAGKNGILFDGDDNALGDITVPTPIELKFKSEFDEKAVKANYMANLYIEIVACP